MPYPEGFDFPKAHSPEHFTFLIHQFGTSDNYNTEFTERLHIELVKDAWRASNRKDAILQMMRWLSCREKIFSFESRFLWLQGRIKRHYTRVPSDFPHINISHRPSLRNVSIDTLSQTHHAPDFLEALKQFVVEYRDLSDRPRRRSRQSTRHVSLPFHHIDVWHHAKFITPNVQSNKAPDTFDIAHAVPSRLDRGRKTMAPARFDTVFVNHTGAEEIGMEGMYLMISSSYCLFCFQVFGSRDFKLYSAYLNALIHLYLVITSNLPNTLPIFSGLLLLLRRILTVACSLYLIVHYLMVPVIVLL